MRYIQKDEEPDFMLEWKRLRLFAGQSLSYSDFNEKRRLNDLLRNEQHGICCYCEKPIDHFMMSKERGAHNEHLIPEKGEYGDFSEQMDYYNIFACCIESSGRKKDSQHCGESKHDLLIYPFLQDVNCKQYFKYNVLGEIIPNGSYNTWTEYIQNEDKLEPLSQCAVEAIKILNLNCNSLVTDRKDDIDTIMRITISWDKKRKDIQISHWEHSSQFPRFIDMLEWFLKR